jgi:hypothetical protein
MVARQALIRWVRQFLILCRHRLIGMDGWFGAGGAWLLPHSARTEAHRIDAGRPRAGKRQASNAALNKIAATKAEPSGRCCSFHTASFGGGASIVGAPPPPNVSRVGMMPGDGAILENNPLMKPRAIGSTGIILLALLNAKQIRAQPLAAPAFEVASVKPSNTLQGVKGGLHNMELIKSGPDWIAKAEDPRSATEAQLRHMLQTLLIDRFQLRFHRETVEKSGFALVVARKGPSFTSQPPRESE